MENTEKWGQRQMRIECHRKAGPNVLDRETWAILRKENNDRKTVKIWQLHRTNPQCVITSFANHLKMCSNFTHLSNLLGEAKSQSPVFFNIESYPKLKKEIGITRRTKLTQGWTWSCQKSRAETETAIGSTCVGAAGETRNRGHSPLGVLGPASERAGESESDVWRKLSLRFSPEWNIQVLDDQLILLCSFDRQANLFISSHEITPSFSSQTSKEGKIVIS